ncbi:hypothetical protein [Streptomyces sp. NPDC058861]|uniref:hypothetical protein n=1 Tax=Streptomyces sp. NPDC058861 TaxID=3346653 RepID=UPI0036C22004
MDDAADPVRRSLRASHATRPSAYVPALYGTAGSEDAEDLEAGFVCATAYGPRPIAGLTR